LSHRKAIFLDESRAQVHLGRVGGGAEQRWYLDSGANNHMMGSVKFGDGSKVEIRGRGTVIFQCQNGEHRTLIDVYYIP
jgi:hypothetical protein